MVLSAVYTISLLVLTTAPEGKEYIHFATEILRLKEVKPIVQGHSLESGALEPR